MTTLAVLGLLITMAALFGWISARRLHLPTTIGTMLLTAVLCIALDALQHVAPGLHDFAARFTGSVNFERLILHGLLATLLFAGAFLLDLERLAKEKLAVGVLALGATLLSVFAVAWITHTLAGFAGLDLARYGGWLPCLFFGALISPTDPIAVLEMLGRVGAPADITARLAGESLFNDGVAAVIFLAVLGAARGHRPSFAGIGVTLVFQAGGGLLLGIALAWLASRLIRSVHEYYVEILLSLALAAGGYALAEALHVSAPLEAVAAGLALRWFSGRAASGEISHRSLDHFWKAIDEVQNAVLFVLLGLELLEIAVTRSTVFSGMFAIVLVLLVRAGSVAAMVLLLRIVQRGRHGHILLLTLGGLRGGLSLALALSVPEAFGRDWIVPTTYIVVFFSLVVQGGAMDLFLRKYGERLT
jgi:CPA1 family monovalent cation:H+ antiporter